MKEDTIKCPPFLGIGAIGAIGDIGLDESQAADYLSLLLNRVMKSMDAPKMEFPLCRFAMAAIRKNL